MTEQQLANPAGAYGLTATTEVQAKSFKNNEASTTIAKGRAVKLDTSVDNGTAVLRATAAAITVIGIALEDIPAGEFGMVQTGGVFIDATSSGAIADLAFVISDATGQILVAAGTETKGQVLGWAVGAAASNLVNVYFANI